eukprot:RCo002518
MPVPIRISTHTHTHSQRAMRPTHTHTQTGTYARPRTHAQRCALLYTRRVWSVPRSACVIPVCPEPPFQRSSEKRSCLYTHWLPFPLPFFPRPSVVFAGEFETPPPLYDEFPQPQPQPQSMQADKPLRPPTSRSGAVSLTHGDHRLQSPLIIVFFPTSPHLRYVSPVFSQSVRALASLDSRGDAEVAACASRHVVFSGNPLFALYPVLPRPVLFAHCVAAFGGLLLAVAVRLHHTPQPTPCCPATTQSQPHTKTPGCRFPLVGSFLPLKAFPSSDEFILLGGVHLRNITFHLSIVPSAPFVLRPQTHIYTPAHTHTSFFTLLPCLCAATPLHCPPYATTQTHGLHKFS